ncbi:hypothetical protein XENORESO_005653 [Xenotaenia resolanae]|uniref:DH domain-containing protein n=1 Tax=Xenotaenia resolanae TaxID=208358 RepID=A0ABV0WWZ0_9TELE
MSFNVRVDSMYGFKIDNTSNLEYDLKPGNGIPIGFSNVENDFHGRGGTTDHPEDYREASSDEELPCMTFQSKYMNIFPLYQEYSLQAIRDEVGKLKDGFVSDLLKSGSFHGLRSSSTPRDNLEAASSCLTPDSNSSPTNFHGRRSAVRRHSHCGVVSPNQSPNSSFAEPCFHERAASLSSSRCLEYKTPEICIEDPSPTPPPSIKLTSCTLWQDLEEVKASGLLNIVTPKEISLQESMFELIGSEVSYLKSLGVVVNHFCASKELKKTMSEMEHCTVFHNIRHVMEANSKFLLDLEVRLGESLIIFQVGDIVLQHCGNFQQHYVPYVSNMTYQETTVNQLMYQRFIVLDYVLFPEHVTVLQNKVLGLPPDSFLLNLSQSQIGPPTAMILIANGSFEKEVWIKAFSKK